MRPVVDSKPLHTSTFDLEVIGGLKEGQKNMYITVQYKHTKCKRASALENNNKSSLAFKSNWKSIHLASYTESNMYKCKQFYKFIMYF